MKDLHLEYIKNSQNSTVKNKPPNLLTRETICPGRERQTKTTMRYHYTTITMSKHLKTVEITKFWQTQRETGSFVHCYWEYTATLESSPAVSCKN